MWLYFIVFICEFDFWLQNSKMKNMENGEGNIESKFAGMVVSDTNNINTTDGLFQVMKAVEAAEATIKQQVFLSLSFSLPYF